MINKVRHLVEVEELTKGVVIMKLHELKPAQGAKAKG